MGLNDEFYSKLVNYYEDMNDEKIQKFNARLILLLLNEVEDEQKIQEIFKQMDVYRDRIL
tara:strand:- start:779 stop:958 length:180 start_codon:yes stop_codon:yes gene_type:complete